MGKVGKAAKKRQRQALAKNPLVAGKIKNLGLMGGLGGFHQHIELEEGGKEEVEEDGMHEELTENELEITIKTLAKISRNEALFQSKECRPIRQLLFQLVDIKKAEGASLTMRISKALRDARWNEAIYLLACMREKEQIPKLGALQRWTRDLDAVDVEKTIIKVLDAVLRTSDPSTVGCADPTFSQECIKRLDPFKCFDPSTAARGKLVIQRNPEKFKSLFSIVYKEQGSDRKPANQHDMILYSSHKTPFAIPLNPPTEPTISIPVPNLPGVTVLKNILSVQECCDIVSASESIGFTPDKPSGGSAKEMNSVLAENFFYLADSELVDRVYQRALPFLPPFVNGQAIAGMNSRWRVYKYTPGSIYRPHIDGAWPGSGLDSNEDYIYDAYGDRWSRLTFLIRLNDEFLGGATTYFTPSMVEGCLDAMPVSPAMGDALVFPHGDTQGTLLHEGSPVIDSNGEFIDVKYVIRTEILYLIPGHTRKEI